jgi:hypothetical protein
MPTVGPRAEKWREPGLVDGETAFFADTSFVCVAGWGAHGGRFA